MMMKILIINRSISFVTTVRDFLEAMGYDVRVAYDGKAGLEVYQQEFPDMVLLSVNLLKINGFELLRLLREKNSFIPVLFLLEPGEGNHEAVDGLKRGADDFIRACTLAEIEARMESVLRRCWMFRETSGVYRFSDNTYLDPAESQLSVHGIKEHLTPLEERILILLWKNRGRLVSREQLMVRCWYEVTEETTMYLNKYMR